MVKKFAHLAIGFAATLGLITVAQVANAADKPYEVFPDRIVFQSPMVDNGHVNIRLTNGQQLNWHMEGKCITKTDHECANIRHHRVGLTLHEEALLIGKTVLPVSVPAGECIEWVQWSETGYHYGEQGEPPVCGQEPPVTEEDAELAPTLPTRVETAAASGTGLDWGSYWVGFLSAGIAFGFGIPIGIYTTNRLRARLEVRDFLRAKLNQ